MNWLWINQDDCVMRIHSYLSAAEKRYLSKAALFWDSITKHQPVSSPTDTIPPITNQYRPKLVQYHQVPTSTALQWPNTTKYDRLELE